MEAKLHELEEWLLEDSNSHMLYLTKDLDRRGMMAKCGWTNGSLSVRAGEHRHRDENARGDLAFCWDV